MADVLRSCSKTACRWPAAASLSYRYATRQVWLLDLAATRDPSLYDLCPHHADALVVPKGWERVDNRTAPEIMVEPSADDRAEEAARRRISAAEPAITNVRSLVGAASGSGGGRPRNRYADLVDQLPRLAAEAGVPGAAETITAHVADQQPVTITARPIEQHPAASREPAEDRSATISRAAQDDDVIEQRPRVTITAAPPPAPPRPIASEPPLPPDGATAANQPGPETAHPAGSSLGMPAPGRKQARAGTPMPSRDLAPLPPQEPPLPPAESSDTPLPGQLSIPVDLDDDDRGVVVPFELVGSRRRTPRT